MMYRTVITIAHTGEVLYGQFNEICPTDLEATKEVFENISKVTYLSLTSPEGDFTYVKGDAIAHVKLEASRS